jgi:transposase
MGDVYMLFNVNIANADIYFKDIDAIDEKDAIIKARSIIKDLAIKNKINIDLWYSNETSYKKIDKDSLFNYLCIKTGVRCNHCESNDRAIELLCYNCEYLESSKCKDYDYTNIICLGVN